MLSNKMTFSLMSLITIIALAFVAPSAMAQDFDVTLDMTGDVGTADNLQVRHPGTSLTVTFEAGEAIVLPAASVFVVTYDAMDEIVSIPAVEITPATAAKILMVTIPVDRSIVKVSIKINEGIEAADPLNTKKSKKVDVNIDLVGGDQGGPTVYSIRRAADPLLPVTADTFQVIITLSEMAKEFKKENVRISDNATITKDPEALEPVPEITPTRALANATITRTFRGVPPVVRGLYNVDLNGNGASTADADISSGERGIHGLITAITGATANAAADDTTANAIPATKYTPPSLTSAQITMYETTILSTATAFERAVAVYNAEAGITALTLDATAATGILPVEMPTTAAWPQIAYPTMVTINYTAAAKLAETEAADLITFSGVNATTFPGDAPDPLDFDTLAAYDLAKTFHDYKQKAKDIYEDGVAVYMAYMDAVAAVEALDSAAAEAYLNIELTTTGGDRPAIQLGTGRTDMLYPYVVTIAPKYANKDNIVIKAGAFEDATKPISNKYIPPDERFPPVDLTEGVNMLTVKVGKEILVPLGAGVEVVIPKEKRIPASGHLVLATNVAGSGIKKPAGSDKDEPKAHERTPAQLKYNVVELGLPNLQTFLANGGTIALVAPAGVYISEIMWGTDSSLSPQNNSQWIEISNSGAASVLTGDKTHKLIFYGLNETPASGAVDTVGTVGTGGFWQLTGKGQSGRTGTDEKAADIVAVVPTLELISMQRKMNADGTPADGTLEGSWVQSKGPAVNFDTAKVGVRIGSPGAPIDAAKYPETPTPDTPAPTVPTAAAADVMITEIMVDTGNGRSPQWIELTYSGMAKATLDGWEMVIDNAIDADVLGGGNAITVSLSGVMLDVSAHTGNTGKGHSALVTAWPATRKSANISDDRVINLATQLNQVSRYQLLSYKGFRITLVPPRTGATIASFGDIAGNLHEDWEVPMSEGDARSSIIRREMVAGAATMGTDAAGWILADSTSLTTGQPTFYGNDEDAGTPGHDSGGPLPVELSHFRPARDKTTGAAVITWSTQSELNNAGFFIKRSQQRNGQFKVINATMIPGAGTTSEKQFYTFTDTTAQPNVVYYYQIEDVSLDGNRQTLTLGTRLKGHIGAHGKLTTSWGELKSVQ